MKADTSYSVGFFFDYCTYPDIIPHKRLYIHNPAICHSLCLSHEHSSYDIGLDNGIDNADDIDDQPNPNIYQYEKNGNLRRDNQEHIQLEWTMAGKVKKVINTLTTNTKAEFLYDAMGNRVRKTVYTSAGNVDRNIFYTYAPDGKLLQMTEQSNTGLLLSMEYPLYGISRLGLYKVTSSLSRDDESANLHIFPRYFDRRMYELTDHLGNVRAVVGDRILWNSSFAGEFRAKSLRKTSESQMLSNYSKDFKLFRKSQAPELSKALGLTIPENVVVSVKMDAVVHIAASPTDIAKDEPHPSLRNDFANLYNAMHSGDQARELGVWEENFEIATHRFIRLIVNIKGNKDNQKESVLSTEQKFNNRD